MADMILFIGVYLIGQIIKAKSIKGSETTKISLENTRWVDVNERILVKSESKSGNLNIGEMYLVEEIGIV